MIPANYAELFINNSATRFQTGEYRPSLRTMNNGWSVSRYRAALGRPIRYTNW